MRQTLPSPPPADSTKMGKVGGSARFVSMVSNGLIVLLRFFKAFQWFAIVCMGFSSLAKVFNGFDGSAMVSNGLGMVWQWFAVRRQGGDGGGADSVTV